MADYVDIALQNAAVPLSQRGVQSTWNSIDSQNGQVLKQAQEQTSLSQRSQQLDESKREFDIVSDLRDRQQNLQYQQSMAQIAGINAETDLRQQALQSAQRAFEQVPYQQQAASDAQSIIAKASTQAKNPQDWDNMVQSDIAGNPNISKYFQGGPNGLSSYILQSKAAFQSAALQQLQIKQQLADQNSLIQAQTYGLIPDDYLQYDSNGNPTGYNFTSLRSDLNNAIIQQKKDLETSKQQAMQNRQQAIVSERNAGKMDEINARNKERTELSGQKDLTTRISQEDSNYRTALRAGNKQAAQDALYRRDQLIQQQKGNPPEDSTIPNLLNSPSDFSVAPTNSKPSNSSGYTVGQKYGGLQYLGGDPKLQSSWK